MTQKYSLLGSHLQNIYNTSELNDQSFQEIEKIVQEEGLTTATLVAEFLVTTLKQMQERNPKNQSILISDERARAIHNHLTDAPPPKMRELCVPFLYNGIIHEPGDIKKFAEKHLHYFVSQVGSTSLLTVFEHFHEVIAYTKSYVALSIAESFLKIKPQDSSTFPGGAGNPSGNGNNNSDIGLGSCDIPCPDGAPRPNANVQFFEDINFNGEVLELGYGHGISNVGSCTLHTFLGFETEDWNDNISSIQSGDGTAIAYEHADFRGSTLTIYGSTPLPDKTTTLNCCPRPLRTKTTVRIVNSWRKDPNQSIARLPDIGWNDRISSVLHGSYF
jgi:hypothetical protein